MQTKDQRNTAADRSDRDAAAHIPAAARQVDVDGQIFFVAPMRVRQVMQFLPVARPVFAALLALASSPATPGLPPAPPSGEQGGDPSRTPVAAPQALPTIDQALGDPLAIMDLIEQHGDGVIQALAIALDADVAQLEDLTVVGLVTLVKHFMVVNADFLKAQGMRLPQGGQGAGAPTPGARAAAAVARARKTPRKRR